jgi:hypothetical protein
MISCHFPKRMSTCNFIGTNPSSQSAIGGTSVCSSSSGRVAIISAAAASAGSSWPRNIAP